MVWPYSQSYGFSSGHVWMWELDWEEGWAPKNWCFWTVVLEKTLGSPLDCNEIQPVHSEGDQPWDFFGRNDAEAETPVLWPLHAKSWLIGKDSDAGRDWGQEEKGMIEDETAGWHHWLNGYEYEWTPGVGDGQGGLACCSSWGHKEYMTERLNWTDRCQCNSSSCIICFDCITHYSRKTPKLRMRKTEKEGCIRSSFSQYFTLLLTPVQCWITDPWRKIMRDFQEHMESLVWWSNPCHLNSPLRSHLGQLLSWLKLLG